MINTKIFEDDLIFGMRDELRKQAMAKEPDLVKAANCLHTALEIFEQVGLTARADDVLKLLQKIAQQAPKTKRTELPAIGKLMQLGLKENDILEFSKRNPIAVARFNLVLRKMGLPDHEIVRLLGADNFMAEKDALDIVNPNRSFSKIQKWLQNPVGPDDPEKIEPGQTLEFKSIAQQKIHDPATQGLTSEKQVNNLKQYGTPLNVNKAEDKSSKLKPEDMEADFEELLADDSFDIDASDDELMGIEVKDDFLQVFDQEDAASDFEDERD